MNERAISMKGISMSEARMATIPAKVDNPAEASTPVIASDVVAVLLTAGDIADGQRGLTNRCPVALAVRRATGIKVVSIRSTQGVLYGQEYQSFDLPAEAREFIARYDTGETVEPLAFDIILVPYRAPVPCKEDFTMPGKEDFWGEATA